MDYLNDHLFGVLNALLIIAAAFGGMLAFRQAQKAAIIKLKDETIKALNDKIDSIESRIADLQKENTSQGYIIETIQAALKQRGILVTIDGELVTISDAQGSHSIRHSSPSATRARPQRRAPSISKIKRDKEEEE